MTEHQSPYAHPDLRKQTIREAEAFINQKRVSRMIMLTTFQQKTAAKLATLKGKELEAFKSRKERVDKALQKIADSIQSAERAIASLNNTHNNITNIESEEVKL